MADRPEHPRRDNERFQDLDDETRDFLRHLRPQDIEQLKTAMHVVQMASQWTRLLKWLAITAIGAFIMGGQVVDAFTKVKGWLLGIGK